jgi:serine acetyltransferase
MHGVKITSGAKLHDSIYVGSGAAIILEGSISSSSEIEANSVLK